MSLSGQEQSLDDKIPRTSSSPARQGSKQSLNSLPSSSAQGRSSGPPARGTAAHSPAGRGRVGMSADHHTGSQVAASKTGYGEEYVSPFKGYILGILFGALIILQIIVVVLLSFTAQRLRYKSYNTDDVPSYYKAMDDYGQYWESLNFNYVDKITIPSTPGSGGESGNGEGSNTEVEISYSYRFLVGLRQMTASIQSPVEDDPSLSSVFYMSWWYGGPAWTHVEEGQNLKDYGTLNGECHSASTWDNLEGNADASGGNTTHQGASSNTTSHTDLDDFCKHFGAKCGNAGYGMMDFILVALGFIGCALLLKCWLLTMKSEGRPLLRLTKFSSSTTFALVSVILLALSLDYFDDKCVDQFVNALQNHMPFFKKDAFEVYPTANLDFIKASLALCTLIFVLSLAELIVGMGWLDWCINRKKPGLRERESGIVDAENVNI